MKRLILSVLLIATAATSAWGISQLARYKTFGREVLTAAHLNELQDQFLNKINEIIDATADSNYVYLRADTLVVADYLTSGGTIVSVTSHGHTANYYTESEADALLAAKAASSHAHAGTDLTSATGSGNPVLATSPDLGGTPTVGSGNTIWHKGNDGASSELDADLLDGQQGSYYAAEGATGQVQVYDSDGTFEGDANLVFNSGMLKIGGTPTGSSELQVSATGEADIIVVSGASNDAKIAFYEATSAKGVIGVDASSSDDIIFLNHDGGLANGVNISESGKVGIEATPDGSADLTLGAGGLKFSDGSTQTIAADVLNGQTSSGAQFTPQFILGGTAYPSIYFKSSTASSEFWELVHDETDGMLFAQGSNRLLQIDNDGVSVKAESVTSGYEFYVNGDAEISGNLQEGSDDRYKTNTIALTGVLAAIRDWDAYEYEWSDSVPRGQVYEDDGVTKRRYVGVSAQQVAEDYPVVATEADGMYGVQYSRLVPVLLAAIQELEARVAGLEGQ